MCREARSEKKVCSVKYLLCPPAMCTYSFKLQLLDSSNKLMERVFELRNVDGVVDIDSSRSIQCSGYATAC